MKSHRFIWSSIAIVAFLFVLGATSNWGQGVIEETLYDRIDVLEQRFNALQRRVTNLESRLSVTDDTAGDEVLMEPWRDPETWSSLYKGMAMHEVVEILGEPIAQSASTSFEFWYYPDETSAWVSFNSSGSVMAWSRP